MVKEAIDVYIQGELWPKAKLIEGKSQEMCCGDGSKVSELVLFVCFYPA